MKRLFARLVLLLGMLGTVASCNGAAAEVTSPATLPTGAPGVIKLTYFYESDACFCLALAGEWIRDTVHNEYKSQLEGGKLTYNEYDTKDAANKAKMEEFTATNYAFFITVNKGGQPSTHSVNGLWLYTDSSGKNEMLKSKFIGLLRKEIDKALTGA